MGTAAVARLMLSDGADADAAARRRRADSDGTEAGSAAAAGVALSSCSSVAMRPAGSAASRTNVRAVLRQAVRDINSDQPLARDDD
jgi:hypothetical protein